VVIEQADCHDFAGERRKSQAIFEIFERNLVLFFTAGFPLNPSGDVLLCGLVERIEILADGLYIENKLVVNSATSYRTVR
jgi:hypothetical protein